MLYRSKMSSLFSYWRVQKKLPDPTGPFTVGCTDYMCAENESVGGKNAGSFIRFFYPVDMDKTAGPIDESKCCFWMPREEYTTGLLKFMKLPVWLLSQFFYWTVGSLRIPAVYNAPVFKPSSCSLEMQSLPCVVFSHGLGGNRLLYSTYCCDLASHGCLVACVEHRFELSGVDCRLFGIQELAYFKVFIWDEKGCELSFGQSSTDESASATYILKEKEDSEITEEWIQYHPLKPSYNEFEFRNNQVHKRADECIYAHNLLEKIHAGECPHNLFKDSSILTQLKGRLDLSKVAVVGHSFGGATTVLTLAKDKRFRCGVTLDVWMLPLGEEIFKYDVDQPLFFINTQAFHRWKENMEPLKNFINKKPDQRPIIAIRWTKHMNQCDIPSVLPPYILRMTSLGSKLDPSTAVGLHRGAVWAFISRHLDIGKPPSHLPIIDGGEGTPELIVIGQEWPEKRGRDINMAKSAL